MRVFQCCAPVYSLSRSHDSYFTYNVVFHRIFHVFAACISVMTHRALDPGPGIMYRLLIDPVESIFVLFRAWTVLF